MAPSRLNTLLLLLLLPASVAVSFQPINCPGPKLGPKTAACSYTAPTDVAIALFFQIEPADMKAEDEKASAFSCTDGAMTLCARGWSKPETGSAGDCFFLLPKGRTLKCVGTSGNVNVRDHLLLRLLLLLLTL